VLKREKTNFPAEKTERNPSKKGAKKGRKK
jgi:hypothetical protein